MPARTVTPGLAALRAQIAAMEGDGGPARGVLPIGLPELDRRLPGPVLWCVTRADLFVPGLGPERVIHVEARDDVTVLASMEEWLRHGGLAAVVAEVARLSITASRRLHLAAKGTGTTGIALRRWRRSADAAEFGQPTAAMSRWRISELPSAALPVPGLGRARWLIELIRARACESFDLELEACDGTGHLGLPAALAQQLGLHAGMPVSKAQALVPGLRVLPAHPAEDAAALERLALWVLQRFSPVVAVDPPDGIVIDSTGTDHLHGGEAAMLEALTGRLAMSGVTARAAIAET